MAEHATNEYAAGSHGAHAHNPLGPEHLFGHVKDSEYIELPRLLGGKIALPQWRDTSEPLLSLKTGIAAIDARVEPMELKFTKFMVVELIAALLMIVFFTRLAAKIKGGSAPKGSLTNALEALIVFIRDQVARPAIGHHDADRFMPYLLTAFFFIVTCNLMGLVPWSGSPTGALATTGALAVLAFGMMLTAGMAKLGPVGFWRAQVPHVDLSPALAIILKPGIFFIEVFGLCIKHFVLAMRLFANMMAGHLVLSVILAFIAATASSIIWWGVMPASVLGSVALSLLELLVAFIQAYVFTFLSALFIGMAVHPH